MTRGVLGFLALTAAGLGALFFFTFEGDVFGVLRGLHPGFLALALLSGGLDLILGPTRFQVFLRKLVPGTRFRLPLTADLVGRFLGAITPSQTGGAPGQIFILYRGGIPLPTILSVLMVGLTASLTVLILSGGVALLVLQEEVGQGALRHLVTWGTIVFAGLVALVAVSVSRPGWITGPLVWSARRVGPRSGRLGDLLRRGAEALERAGDQYRTSFLECVQRDPALPLAVLLITVVLYLNKFTLAWLLMKALGVDGPYLLTVAVQAVLHFILYVAPTPGGSGIAEVSTGALMALVLPTQLLGPFTLVYRFLLGYLPAAAGAVGLALTLQAGAGSVDEKQGGPRHDDLALNRVGPDAAPGPIR